MSGYYDQNNEWHYNKTCIYDEYYTEGCSSLDGEYDEDGIWIYDDPCSLDDEDDDDDDDDDYDDDDYDDAAVVRVNVPAPESPVVPGNSTLAVSAVTATPMVTALA
jgi:hypothetical protein